MALYSMTAYGYGEKEGDGLTYTCEVRTLNSRFIEVNVRLPRSLLALEVDIINHAKSKLRRGKVDIFVDLARAGQGRELPVVDPDAARHYLKMAAEMSTLARSSGISDLAPLSLAELTRLEGVLIDQRGKARGADAADLHRTGIFAALDGALTAVNAARLKEGSALAKAMRDLLADLERDRMQVASRRDSVLQQLHKNVLKRIDNVISVLAKSGQPVSPGISEERLAMEVLLVSDKADIDEELTRLATHIREYERVIVEEDGAGKKLDFLCQEMHREVNTMSSKLVQTEVSQFTLEMKQTIERLRQQVQNIE